jgi:UDP-glucose 4-epimerase
MLTNSQHWVVTGAAGFLGSHVVELLLQRGVAVLGLDDFSGGKRQFLAPYLGHPHLTLLQQDIREVEALRRLFEQYRPVAVIHLAALHYIPACTADPVRTISLNVLGTQCVLTAARETAVERFFFASTGDVYLPSEQPHHEERSPTGPFNIYGLSKWMGEQLVQMEGRQRPQGRFVIGRLFNLYGPRETNPHILPEILGQLRRSSHQSLHLGHLWPKRDLVPVADAARAVVELMERAEVGVTTVNIATGVAVSMQEVVEILGQLLGRTLRVVTDPSKIRPVERPHLQADVTRLRHLLGWTPHADLVRGLAELLRHEALL